MTNIKGKTGRFPLAGENDPLVGQPFAKKFYLPERDEAGNTKEAPYGILEERIGKGGFGVVYKIRFHVAHPWRTELNLGPFGAVKILTNSENEEAVKRFEREGKIGLILSGEDKPDSLARIVEYGETSDKNKFILMQYVDNPEDLGLHVAELPVEQKVERLSLEESLYAINSLVEAIDYAHRKGVAHRDVKPSNLVRNKKNKNEIKLIDFGIGAIINAEQGDVAQVDEATVDALTKDKDFRGSVHYASPEAARGEGEFRDYPKDVDVWGVGATAYALLSGQPPYTSSDQEHVAALAILGRIARYEYDEENEERKPGKKRYDRKQDVVFLKELDPKIPWPINDWVMRCLDKDRKRRLRSNQIKSEYQKALDEIGLKVQ